MMLRRAASLLACVLGQQEVASVATQARLPALLRLSAAATPGHAASAASSCLTDSRQFHSSPASTSGSDGGSGDTISVTFIEKDGKPHTVRAPIGKNLLEVAHDNEVDLEGACEASLACSTCHVIVENEEYFKRLPEASEDELDMLDLAFGLTDTSRLGCQLIATKDIDGIVVRIPAASRNFYVDGHKPKPH